ncbi:MAG: hypothetical protein IEMM0008_1010 [bacterium]|nr:MAG: hypothetical protein IEMM0008_1010 [bacterium]
MHKYLILAFGIFILSCDTQTIIPLSSVDKGNGGNILLLSFVKDNPRFLVNDEPFRAPKRERISKKKIVRYSDLTDLDEPDNKPQDNSDLSDLEKPSEKKFTFADALKNVGINRYLMKSFIIHFRKRSSRFNIKHNLKLSKKKVPFLRGTRPGEFPRNGVDRDFTSIYKKLNSHLILELRVLKLAISNDMTPSDPREESGFLDTYGVILKVKGILFDLDKNKKIWESVDIEIWTDTGIYSQAGLAEKKGTVLIQYYKGLADVAAKKLVEFFFND